jgi:ribosome-binding factor A
MSSGKHRRRRGAHADDHGIDPSMFFEDARNDARGERKVQQLCREVERTLSCALGACSDDQLRNLVVVSVDPAPDGSRLLVSLASAVGTLDVDVGVLLKRVQDVRGFLRSEVAAAIQRKRTPELAFQIITRTEPEVTR